MTSYYHVTDQTCYSLRAREWRTPDRLAAFNLVSEHLTPWDAFAARENGEEVIATEGRTRRYLTDREVSGIDRPPSEIDTPFRRY